MRKLSFAFSAVFILACSDKNKIPEDILPKQKMQAVLWDMIRAGEFLDVYVLNRDTAMDKNAKVLEWYDNIYRLHHVSRAGFEKSYAYYRQHPSLMKEVLDSLSKKQEMLPKEPPPVTVGSDSVRPEDSQSRKKILLPGRDRPGQVADSMRKRRLLQKTRLQ